jgi:hypothetical protein
MRTETRLFTVVTVVMFGFATSYAIWRKLAWDAVDWPGVIMLGMGGMLAGMCALYFGVVARRIQPRPEDRPDAEIADGAGEVGFFSPGSYWPFGLAAATAVIGLGLAYWQVWLIVAGAVAVLLATGGLLFEYYTGARRAEPLPPTTAAVTRQAAGRGELPVSERAAVARRPTAEDDRSLPAEPVKGVPVGTRR